MKDLSINSIHPTNKYGYYRLLREIYDPIKFNDNYRPSRKFEIEFINTGYKTIIESSNVDKLDGIRDRYYPSIANTGYIGEFNISIRDPKVFKFYTIWANMINKCYDTNRPVYRYYGARGVTVDPRWYNFTNFYYDIQQLPGWDLKVRYPEIYQLDKDYLQRNIPLEQRIYSKDTCIWISIHDNHILANDNFDTIVGYRGVSRARKGFYTIFEGKIIAYFKTAEAAACYYNYLSLEREKLPHHNISLLNDIQMIPISDLLSDKYIIRQLRQVIFKNNLIEFNDYPVGGEIPHKE